MTQKTLIAIISARHRPEWRKVIRESWLRQVPSDKAAVAFFVGRGEPLSDPANVVQLECSDKYEHLPEKIRAIAQWSLEYGFSYTVKIDDDVVLRPREFLGSGYDRYPYSGRSNRPESPYAIPYGFFYTLNAECMEIVANYKLPEDGSLDDEKWVAYNLSLHGITLHDERRLFLHQWKFPEIEPETRRPLRAPKRPPKEYVSPHAQEPGTFAWCVHIGGEVPDRIKEYAKLWEKYGQK